MHTTVLLVYVVVTATWQMSLNYTRAPSWLLVFFPYDIGFNCYRRLDRLEKVSQSPQKLRACIYYIVCFHRELYSTDLPSVGRELLNDQSFCEVMTEWGLGVCDKRELMANWGTTDYYEAVVKVHGYQPLCCFAICTQHETQSHHMICHNVAGHRTNQCSVEVGTIYQWL